MIPPRAVVTDVTRVIMLTKPNCPQCQSLKMFLKLALRDKYAPEIDIIDQQAQSDRFQTLARQHAVQSLPVLIKDDDILRACGPNETIRFLETHLGKR